MMILTITLALLTVAGLVGAGLLIGPVLFDENFAAEFEDDDDHSSEPK